MKTLIVGRSSRGKDHLRELLETTYGWNFVKSKTTRPPRYEGEDTHQFISKEEAENTPDAEIIAKTIINGEIYFSTKEDLEKADGYIIDPNGIEYLCNMCPNEWFQIVYITADPEVAKKAAQERANLAKDPEAEMNVYNARSEAEDEQFTQFEAMIENKSFQKPCCSGINVFTNDFKEETMENFAITLEMRRRFYENMKPVLTYMKTNEYFGGDKHHVKLFHKESNEPILIRDEKFIQLLAEEPKESMFSYIMEAFMFQPTNDGHKIVTDKG